MFVFFIVYNKDSTSSNIAVIKTLLCQGDTQCEDNINRVIVSFTWDYTYICLVTKNTEIISPHIVSL